MNTLGFIFGHFLIIQFGFLIIQLPRPDAPFQVYKVESYYSHVIVKSMLLL